MRVTYKESESPYSKSLRADLNPTTHQKGGEAWDVTLDGRPAGVLRRWVRTETRMSTTPNTMRIWNTDVVYWTTYPVEGEARVFEKSRSAALRYLRKMQGAAPEVSSPS